MGFFNICQPVTFAPVIAMLRMEEGMLKFI
jgi:hypothetical protein